MAEPAQRAGIDIPDWPGLMNSTGPTASGTPPGSASEQVNLQVNIDGRMATRRGYRKVEFDTE